MQDEDFLRTSLKKEFLQYESLINLYRLLPNLKQLPHTRGWVASPDILLTIAKTILKQKPQQIFEAGSGATTLIIACCLALNGIGKFISFDQDLNYAQKTIELLEINELTSFGEVHHAPLTQHQHQQEMLQWYGYQTHQIPQNIDLLIIDGPTRISGPLARYPVIPLLVDKLASKSTLILDDSNRPDEQSTLGLWIGYLENHTCKVTQESFPHYDKGMAILHIVKP